MRVSEWEWVLRFCFLPLCLMLNHHKMFILVSFKVFKIFFTFLCRRFSIFSQRGYQLIQSCHEKLIEWFHGDDGSSMNGRHRWATAGSVPWTLLAALIMIMLLVLFLTPELDCFLALEAHIKRDSSHRAFLCRVWMLSTCSAVGVLRISLSHIEFLPTAPKMCWKATISPMKQLLPASSVTRVTVN